MLVDVTQDVTYISKQLSLAAVNYLLDTDSAVCAHARHVSKLLNDVTYFFLSFHCSFTVIK